MKKNNSQDLETIPPFSTTEFSLPMAMAYFLQPFYLIDTCSALIRQLSVSAGNVPTEGDIPENVRKNAIYTLLDIVELIGKPIEKQRSVLNEYTDLFTNGIMQVSKLRDLTHFQEVISALLIIQSQKYLQIEVTKKEAGKLFIELQQVYFLSVIIHSISLNAEEGLPFT